MRNDRLAFQSWCSRATAHIRFKADRPAVEQELMEHMEDHFNALLQEGLTLQEAERQTLCAMGDADETGAALAKVHKPYLGWLYLAAKWLVALSAVLLFMVSCSTGLDFSGYGFSEPFQGLSTESDETYRREVTYLYPDCTDECNGYTFSLPVVTHRRGTWTEKQEGMPQTYEAVYFVLEAAHPLPWAGTPEACGPPSMLWTARATFTRTALKRFRTATMRSARFAATRTGGRCCATASRCGSARLILMRNGWNCATSAWVVRSPCALT